MAKRKGISKKELKEIAFERVKQLFKEAKADPERADHYVALARKVAMKVNLVIPKELKRKFCKHCYSYFRPDNFRVRKREKHVVYSCLKCKKFSRYLAK